MSPMAWQGPYVEQLFVQLKNLNNYLKLLQITSLLTCFLLASSDPISVRNIRAQSQVDRCQSVIKTKNRDPLAPHHYPKYLTPFGIT